MTSFHIQDLRLLLPLDYFELRVNKHHSKISAFFREWLRESFDGDFARVEELSNHRFDLLCSLCFPTIDPPQLLRVSKLCALTFFANDGLVQAASSASRSAVCPLTPEHLLGVVNHIRTRQTRELQHTTYTDSRINVLRFAENLFALFYTPQVANFQGPYPGLSEFLTVLESAYDRKLSEELADDTRLTTLWECMTKIVMWSQDLASYMSKHPPECDRCTVCYSLKERGFTLQAAVNDIQQSAQSEVGKFVYDYKSLTANNCDTTDSVTVADAMRDCITGFIHWVYEGERYFGQQYEEVAKFGWVFMDTGGVRTGGNEIEVP